MSISQQRAAMTELFQASGKAHGQAFAASNGQDSEWPLWYAEYLQTPLSRITAYRLTRSELVYCLMSIEFERKATASTVDWPAYYAGHFVERYGVAESAGDSLALYHSEDCPYCVSVRAGLARLGLDIELRDVDEEHQHRDALVAARQRATVPVLRVESACGEVRWIPNSSDIVRYLESTCE